MEEAEIKYLECIYCGKEFEHGDIFVSFINEESHIVISECFRCIDIYDPQEKKEREGTGWVVMQRVYDHYEAFDADDPNKERCIIEAK